jgi:rare lipoprotein A (peptidoglycan hydrolase)
VTARPHGRHLTRTLLALACCATLAVPATALAGTNGDGGGGLGGGPPTTGTSTTTARATPVHVTGDGVTLQTTSKALLSRGLTFTGTAARAAGKTIEIERQAQGTDAGWTQAALATVDSTGAFRATWRTTEPGRFAVRAIVVSDLATVATATPPLTVTVYRGSRATIYGPGFYGRRTACGGRLTRATIGVANRSLPCGSLVSVLYRGRTLTVPVIDRGPYANGADWDLTMATARALGIGGTVDIGTLRIPGRAAFGAQALLLR